MPGGIPRADTPSRVVVLGRIAAALSSPGMVEAVEVLAVVGRRLARPSVCADAAPAQLATFRLRAGRLSHSLLFCLSRRQVSPRHRARTSPALGLSRFRSLG